MGVPINVIGVGGIGSFTVLALTKMGFHNIRVWDYDDVSVENLNAQFYRDKDIGRPKVDALRDIVYEFTGINISILYSKFNSKVDSLNGIVISSVDSMKSRMDIWVKCKGSICVRLFIDPRMGAEQAAIYAALPTNKEDRKRYEDSLHDDSEAEPIPCTAKSTMYTPLFIAGQICKIIKDFLCRDDRDHVMTTLWDIENNHQDCYMRIKGSTNPLSRIQEEE